MDCGGLVRRRLRLKGPSDLQKTLVEITPLARFEVYAEQRLPGRGHSFGRCLARTHQVALQSFAVARLEGKGCASVRQCSQSRGVTQVLHLRGCEVRSFHFPLRSDPRGP